VNYPNEMEILKDFIEVLEKFDIRYAIGGSIASSFYGKARFTVDADINVEPFESSADKLHSTLKSNFCISKDAMNHALKTGKSFNIIHMETSFKIDVFIQKQTPFEKQLFAHSKSLRLSDSMEKIFFVLSPEDIILIKLGWFAKTGQNSQKQWGDILGVLSVQSGRLDYDYLNKWSAELGLNDLLKKALAEIER